MSTEDVRKRLAAATPAPWKVTPHLRAYEMGIEAPHRYGWMSPYDVVATGTEGDGGIASPADAELIAHAPTDLALALDVIEAARLNHGPTDVTDRCRCGDWRGYCQEWAALDAFEKGTT